MRNYTIYFTASTNDVIQVKADAWELENEILSFYILGKTVACFNMNNIFGFEETKM